MKSNKNIRYSRNKRVDNNIKHIKLKTLTFSDYSRVSSSSSSQSNIRVSDDDKKMICITSKLPIQKLVIPLCFWSYIHLNGLSESKINLDFSKNTSLLIIKDVMQSIIRYTILTFYNFYSQRLVNFESMKNIDSSMQYINLFLNSSKNKKTYMSGRSNDINNLIMNQFYINIQSVHNLMNKLDCPTSQHNSKQYHHRHHRRYNNITNNTLMGNDINISEMEMFKYTKHMEEKNLNDIFNKMTSSVGNKNIYEKRFRFNVCISKSKNIENTKFTLLRHILMITNIKDYQTILKSYNDKSYNGSQILSVSSSSSSNIRDDHESWFYSLDNKFRNMIEHVDINIFKYLYLWTNSVDQCKMNMHENLISLDIVIRQILNDLVISHTKNNYYKSKGSNRKHVFFNDMKETLSLIIENISRSRLKFTKDGIYTCKDSCSSLYNIFSSQETFTKIMKTNFCCPLSKCFIKLKALCAFYSKFTKNQQNTNNLHHRLSKDEYIRRTNYLDIISLIIEKLNIAKKTQNITSKSNSTNDKLLVTNFLMMNDVYDIHSIVTYINKKDLKDLSLLKSIKINRFIDLEELVNPLDQLDSIEITLSFSNLSNLKIVVLKLHNNKGFIMIKNQLDKINDKNIVESDFLKFNLFHKTANDGNLNTVKEKLIKNISNIIFKTSNKDVNITAVYRKYNQKNISLFKKQYLRIMKNKLK